MESEFYISALELNYFNIFLNDSHEIKRHLGPAPLLFAKVHFLMHDKMVPCMRSSGDKLFKQGRSTP